MWLFIKWYEVNENKFQDVPVADLPKYLIGVPLYYLRLEIKIINNKYILNSLTEG